MRAKKGLVEPAPVLAPGDIVMKAAERFQVLAVKGVEAEVLPVVMRKGRHRADVPLSVPTGGSAAAVRCVQVERQPVAAFKGTGMALPAILATVRVALAREAATQQGEAQAGAGMSRSRM